MKNTTHRHRFFLWTIIVFSVILISKSMDAAPLFNVPQVLTQPDGAPLHCFITGDEHKHFVHTKEKFIIKQNPKTGYYYTTDKKIAEENTIFNSQLHNKVGDKLLASNEKKNKGNLTNLVIFVRFFDDTEYDIPFSFYDSLFNSNGNSSLTDYYSAVSYNQLSISSYFFPASVGKSVHSYELKHPRNYYLTYSSEDNLIGYKTDFEGQSRKINMIKEILLYLSGIVPTNITLDVNVKNHVDNVTIILKGKNDSWGGILWPYHSTIKSGHGFFQQINGVEVDDYIVLMSNGINVGTICHEFFHSLGAPDLYRYENPNYIYPLFMWDLMESQNTTPQFMTAYMKYKYGKWIDKIPEITSPGEYSLNPLTMPDSNCYVIPVTATESFVLEYRKPEEIYEASLENVLMQFEKNKVSTFDGGLLIYRINKEQAGKGNVNANDSTADEIYCYRPNGTKEANGEPWNSAFNAKYLKNEFSAKTNPAPILFKGDTAKLKIDNIYEDENKLYFTYHNDSITFIKWPLDGELHANRQPVIVWDLLAGAATYYIQISNNRTFTDLEISEIKHNDSVLYLDRVLAPNQYYYARVGAMHQGGHRIIWTNTISFRTTSALETRGFHGPMCAGNSFELQCYVFDATLENAMFDVLLSDKNGTWSNPILLESINLHAGLNSIFIRLPDSLKTGYRYMINLQSKNSIDIFALTNSFTIHGFARAKIYTNKETQADDKEIMCNNSVTKIYFLPDNSATQNTYCNYKWTSKNCEIINTDYFDNSIGVKWDKLGKAEVTLTVSNQLGCQQVYTKIVTVVEAPVVELAAKNNVCAGKPVSYYLGDTQFSTTTSIQIEGGIYKQTHNDSITVTWDNVPVGYLKVVRMLKNGCTDSANISQPINYISNLEIKGNDTIYKKITDLYQLILSNEPINSDQFNIEWKINYGEIVVDNYNAACFIYVDSAMMLNAESNTIELEVTITNKSTLCSETLTKTIVVADSPTSIFENNYLNNNCNITTIPEGIIVKLAEKYSSDNITMELYNILGNKVANDFQASTVRSYISTQHLPTGVYFLRVYSNNKLIHNSTVNLVNEE